MVEMEKWYENIWYWVWRWRKDLFVWDEELLVNLVNTLGSFSWVHRFMNKGV